MRFKVPKTIQKPLLFGLLGALVALLYALYVPNYYVSEARILPVEARGAGGLGQLSAAAAAFGLTVPGQDGGESNYVDIVKSRWLLESLVREPFTFSMKEHYLGIRRTYRQTLAEYLGARSTDQAVALAAHVLSAGKDVKTKLLVISAETRSPELSYQVLQSTVRLLETFLLEHNRTRGANKATYAGQRLQEAQAEYSKAEAGFSQFLETNRNYLSSLDPQTRLRGLRLEGELQLRKQLVTSLALAREQALMEEKDDVPILNILDGGSLPTDKSRPSRALMIAGAFAVAFLGGLVWSRRAWIAQSLLEHAAESNSTSSIM